MKQLTIDLNSDVGESFGPYRMGNDEDLFRHITSANIACGFHAGDPATMRKTLDLAAKHHVAAGAHPGFPDRLHFGRMALPCSNEEITDFVIYQIGALQLMAESAGLTLHHVKLHGALYHMAAENRRLAESLLDAMVRLRHSLIVVGPPDCVLQMESDERGLDYAAEGFADRLYLDDGKLAPRTDPRALLTDPDTAAEQAVRIAKTHKVTSASGSVIAQRVSTLCIHGDTPNATAIALAVRQKLEDEKIAVQPLHRILA